MNDILNSINWQWLLQFVLQIFAVLFCITTHELCHGYVAYKLGDPTAKNEGRLTLNPIKHIDPMGFLMMVFFRFGWAKPVPVNPNHFENPKKGMAITALAGPLSNMIIAVIACFLFNLIPYSALEISNLFYYLLVLLSNIAFLSIALAIFNLIPIPPLDGSKILFSLLPDRLYAKYLSYERYGIIVLMLFVFITRNLNNPLMRVAEWIYSFLMENMFKLVSLF